MSVLRLVLSLAAALAATTFAAPADPLAVADGWATGTTGGAGGTIDTARDSSTLATLLARDGAGIVFVRDTVRGTFNVSAGRKSVLGLAGAVVVGRLDIAGRNASAMVRNVIVRNLTILPAGTCTGDFGLGTCEDQESAMRVSYARSVWLDHLTIRDGLYGNLDIVHGSDSLTLSWIRQSYTRTDTSHQFANLIGASDRNGAEDSLRLRFTWHHSLWGECIRERMPRVRFANAHLYNNVWNSPQANYGIRAAWWSDLLVEACEFRDVRTPLDIIDTNAILQSRDNRFVRTSGDTAGRGTATPPRYPYRLDSAAKVDSLVSPTATGSGANLTWAPLPLAAHRGSKPGTVRFFRRDGRDFAVNEGSSRQILSLRDASGRAIAHRLVLDAGTTMALPRGATPRFAPTTAP